MQHCSLATSSSNDIRQNPWSRSQEHTTRWSHPTHHRYDDDWSQNHPSDGCQRRYRQTVISHLCIPNKKIGTWHSPGPTTVHPPHYTTQQSPTHWLYIFHKQHTSISTLLRLLHSHDGLLLSDHIMLWLDFDMTSFLGSNPQCLLPLQSCKFSCDNKKVRNTFIKELRTIFAHTNALNNTLPPLRKSFIDRVSHHPISLDTTNLMTR